jgi:hypothetical protein
VCLSSSHGVVMICCENAVRKLFPIYMYVPCCIYVVKIFGLCILNGLAKAFFLCGNQHF